jgi:hypothetical protein
MTPIFCYNSHLVIIPCGSGGGSGGGFILLGWNHQQEDLSHRGKKERRTAFIVSREGSCSGILACKQPEVVAMSDTISLGSNVSADVSVPGGLIVEDVGQLTFGDFVPRRMVRLWSTPLSLIDELVLGKRFFWTTFWRLSATRIDFYSARFAPRAATTGS